MMQVVTVTLNPAIDETIFLDALRPGHVHRASGATTHAGGKGVNVASCLAGWGGLAVTATGFLGASNDAVFSSLFATKQIEDAFIRVAGETRTNIKLSHDGDTTDINLPGLSIDQSAIDELREKLTEFAGPGTLVLLAGSLPAGMAPDIYADLTATLTAAGALVLLDTSGAPLTAALTAQKLPFCIKPNRAELETFAGRALPTNADLLAVARDLNRRGVALVVVSLGAEGSLYVGAEILHAALPVVRAVSTVGAGDAMVAGVIAALAEGADLKTIARYATAFAVAKLGEAGPNLPARKIVEALCARVEIRKIGGAES
jgi:1-phosphofructokinase